MYVILVTYKIYVLGKTGLLCILLHMYIQDFLSFFFRKKELVLFLGLVFFFSLSLLQWTKSYYRVTRQEPGADPGEPLNFIFKRRGFWFSKWGSTLRMYYFYSICTTFLTKEGVPNPPMRNNVGVRE
jgi:hypothetical protein